MADTSPGSVVHTGSFSSVKRSTRNRQELQLFALLLTSLNVVTCCCKTGLTLRGGFPTLAVLMPFSDGDCMKQVSYFPGSFHVVTAFAQLLPGVNFLVLTRVEL